MSYLAPPPLPLCVEEHKASHVVTWASFKNRAVGIGLPETQSAITFCGDPAHLPPPCSHDPITFKTPPPQFKRPVWSTKMGVP